MQIHRGAAIATSTPNPNFVPGSGTDAVWGTEEDPAVGPKTCEQEPGAARIELTVLGTRGVNKILLAIAACAWAASGCTAGLQQTVLSPKVEGTYNFSGVDMLAQSPPSWTGQPYTLPIKLAPQGGQVGPMSAVTQLSFGLDLPFLRMVVAPGLNAPALIETLQFDVLYKHPLRIGGEDRWRALIGLSYQSLAAKVAADYVLAVGAPVQVGDALLQNGDEVRYESSESRKGWYATLGAEYEIADWAHLFGQFSARVNQTAERNEDLTITARAGGLDSQGRPTSEDFHVLTDNRFVVTAKQPGVVSANFDLPTLAATIGISFTWPSWKQMRSRGLMAPPAPPRYAPPPPGYKPPPGYSPPPSYPPSAGRAPSAKASPVPSSGALKDAIRPGV